MAVGDDIKDVLVEIGTSFRVLRPNSGELDAEYLDYEMNRQVTKPFIREYFLEAVFPHDTITVGGDVIQFVTDGRVFIVMNTTFENLFDLPIGKEAVLYKCNVSGELLRPSGEVFDTNYRRSTDWTLVTGNCFALLTEKMFGTDLVQDEELAQIGVEAQVLYIPSNVGAQPLDRYQAASGEYYKIEEIEIRKFDGVDVCHIAEDTRY